ncbi:uncharacterized protein VTP21DRAFT_244 [Calcarisporiella thermophila]|uniref:uncharacterized protein n=1 Tax=Calcarisporiella thermophila TaxID=911321 RepID=UPI0037448A79
MAHRSTRRGLFSSATPSNPDPTNSNTNPNSSFSFNLSQNSFSLSPNTPTNVPSSSNPNGRHHLRSPSFSLAPAASISSPSPRPGREARQRLQISRHYPSAVDSSPPDITNIVTPVARIKSEMSGSRDMEGDEEGEECRALGEQLSAGGALRLEMLEDWSSVAHIVETESELRDRTREDMVEDVVDRLRNIVGNLDNDAWMFSSKYNPSIPLDMSLTDMGAKEMPFLR